MDSASAKAGFALSKELIRGLMWLANRRDLMRTEVMTNEILPLYEAMRSNHDDFRYILGRLDRILAQIERQLQQQSNDVAEQIGQLHEVIHELEDRRNARRSERPALRASAGSYANRIDEIGLANKIKLTDQEIEAAKQIFNTIVRYFSDEDGKFGHDLQHHFWRVSTLLRMFEKGKVDDIVEEISYHRRRLKQYSDDREELWREIAEAFGALRTTLHAKH